MSLFLGIDTSNYTTSAAQVSGGRVIKNEKQLLSVRSGERGLRQSDAVFAHTVNLPQIIERIGGGMYTAVGCSAYPRDVAGSYMPCFLVGEGAARAIASTLGVPLYRFSHQAGHIMAAVYSSGRSDLLGREFLAFHVSGGTTELLLVKPDDEKIFSIEKLGGTLDLNAGQIIDRTGVLLGLTFPCGAQLEKLAEQAAGEIVPSVRVSVKSLDCNLSGVENKVQKLIAEGTPHPLIAMYTQNYIKYTLAQMTKNALELYPSYPVLYAGGVMSNSYIKAYLSGICDAGFAQPSFSSDNAAGCALLCEYKHNITSK